MPVSQLHELFSKSPLSYAGDGPPGTGHNSSPVPVRWTQCDGARGQGHVAVAMMMPIAFHHPWRRGRGEESRREGGQQPVGERLAVVEQSFKCEGLRNGTVVKEQVHDAAGRQRHPVSYGR